MGNILDVICIPLGKFLYFIYNTLGFHNYGLAIIIFTVVVKLVLLPLTLKQYKSTTKMQAIQPQLQEIQKRYKNDKEKLNQEMMKLYTENGVNPAGGCFPLLIQMPILISLYWVIVQPLKFMLGKTQDQITKIVEVATSAAKAAGDLLNQQAILGNIRELFALNYVNDHKELLNQVTGMLNANELINFNFLGLHLGKIATYSMEMIKKAPEVYLPLLLLPIIGVVTTFLSTRLSMPKKNPNNSGGQNAMANSMTNSMMYIGPIMTLIFSFQLPAGVVLYWICGYVFQIFQQLYINKTILRKNEQAAEVRKEIKEGGKDSSNVTAEPKQISEKNPSKGTNNKNSSKKKKK